MIQAFIFPFGGVAGVVITLLLVYFLIRFLTRITHVSEKDINKDLTNFREELKGKASGLIPWTDEDLSLLSMNLMEQKKQGRKHVVERGVIKNIYQEPTISYIIKRYGGKEPRTLLVVRTHDFEMVWLRNKSGITIYKDGRQIGNLLRDGKLLDSSGNKMIGYLKQEDNLDLSIFIDDQISALVHKSWDPDVVNPRALEIFSHPIQADKEKILAMSMLDIVESAKKD